EPFDRTLQSGSLCPTSAGLQRPHYRTPFLLPHNLTFFIAPTLTPAFCGPYSRANFSAKFIERSVRHGLASGFACVKGDTWVRLVSLNIEDGKSGDVPTAHWYDSGYCQGLYRCHYSRHCDYRKKS